MADRATTLARLLGRARLAGAAAAPLHHSRLLGTHAGVGHGGETSPTAPAGDDDAPTSSPGGGGSGTESHTLPSPSDLLASAGAYATADALWPTTRRQKSSASRVHRALAAVLADPASAGLRGPDVHTLTIRCGIALGGVRTGPDGRSAHVLYDVTPGTEAAAAAVLAGPLAGPLRSAVGRALGARRAPVLKWTPDRLPDATAAVVAELERLGLPSDVK